MSMRRRSWRILIGCCIAYAALFLRFYPPLSGIEDEVGFVNQSLVWSRGAMTSEAAGFAEVADFGEPNGRPRLMDFVRVGDVHRPSRHPGRSLILLPFVMVGGVRVGFVSGLLIHWATTLIGAALLARLGRSPLWALLILFHPTLALYSRTVTADEAAGGFLVLATFFATRPGRGNAVAAGIAVGVAALMRYHAGLALPVIAASIALDPARDRRRGDGLAAFVAGGSFGGVIVAYNLLFYGALLDPVGAQRGQFGLTFARENAPFYFVALMSFWPGMLLAPALDRSVVGGIARGLSTIYLGFFTLYYFHDRAGGILETSVVGLRLMQVALPVWIVSYAGAIDDRIVRPLRRRIGVRAVGIAAACVGLGLLGATATAFQKHQAHLSMLKKAHDAIVAEAPGGSVIVAHGGIHKLFGIPSGGPVYRWRMLEFQGTPIDRSAELDRLESPWFLAVLARGEPLPDSANAMIEAYRMRRIAPTIPSLILYRAEPPRRAIP